jgi:hypothetical protein
MRLAIVAHGHHPMLMDDANADLLDFASLVTFTNVAPPRTESTRNYAADVEAKQPAPSIVPVLEIEEYRGGKSHLYVRASLGPGLGLGWRRITRQPLQQGPWMRQAIAAQWAKQPGVRMCVSPRMPRVS